MVDLRAEGKPILDVEYLLHLIDDLRPVLDQFLAQYLHLRVVGHFHTCLWVRVLYGTDKGRCLVDSGLLFHGSFEEAELGCPLLVVHLFSPGLA